MQTSTPADGLGALKAGIEKQRDSYKNSAFRWRFGYRTFLVLSAILSATTAVVPEVFSGELAKDLAVILPATVTVIATVLAALNFENNWRVNRVARHRLDMLLVDVGRADFDDNSVREEFKKIIQFRLDEFEKSD